MILDVLQSNKAESDKLSHGDEISIGDENEFDDLNYDETPFQEEEEEEEVPSVQHGNLDDMVSVAHAHREMQWLASFGISINQSYIKYN